MRRGKTEGAGGEALADTAALPLNSAERLAFPRGLVKKISRARLEDRRSLPSRLAYRRGKASLTALGGGKPQRCAPSPIRSLLIPVLRRSP